jgi:oxygen-dependent protoporphyrinogen oxidase
VAVRAGAEGAEFHGVVVAVPAPAARVLLRNPPAALAEWLAGVKFQPALTLGLLLDRPVGVRYFGLSLPRDGARSVVAACVEENKGAELVPEGRGLVVAFARPEVAASLVEAEGRQVLDAMLPDLLRALPRLDERVVRARVYRWPTGNPVLYPGYLAHLGAYRRSMPEGEGPVALAGDYLYQASVEGAVTSGEAAAARLLRRLSVAGAGPV